MYNFVPAFLPLSATEQPIACKLLTEDEKQRLAANLGTKCTANCAAVVCVYEPEGSTDWRLLYSGVAAIVKDRTRRSYYGDRFPVGLAFADAEEASTFRDSFTHLLTKWGRSRDSVTHSHSVDKPNTVQVDMHKGFSIVTCSELYDLVSGDGDDFWVGQMPDSTGSLLVSAKIASAYKQTLPIGAPTNFVHLQHLGFNKESQQFDMSGIDDDMLQKFFKDNNLQGLLKSQEDAKFAINFIAQNVGIETYPANTPNPEGICTIHGFKLTFCLLGFDDDLAQ
ncbi:unnamed protein product [Dibothriocephalus latus]|uniref:CRIB domain-containing protein n=1 Tax=Dibothriocephalus latus TaxID=60516 RepID=A0A3P6U1F7_DIBLA|nr:unnamed protein product [Dibothriocephalus latus]